MLAVIGDGGGRGNMEGKERWLAYAGFAGGGLAVVAVGGGGQC